MVNGFDREEARAPHEVGAKPLMVEWVEWWTSMSWWWSTGRALHMRMHADVPSSVFPRERP